MNIDYDIARILIDDIIPFSLEYFLGINEGYEGSQNILTEQDEEDENEDLILNYDNQKEKFERKPIKMKTNKINLNLVIDSPKEEHESFLKKKG